MCLNLLFVTLSNICIRHQPSGYMDFDIENLRNCGIKSWLHIGIQGAVGTIETWILKFKISDLGTKYWFNIGIDSAVDTAKTWTTQ